MEGPVICGVEDWSSAGAVEAAGALAEHHRLPLLYVHVLGRRGQPGEEGLEELLAALGARPDGELLLEQGHPGDRLLTLARERRASFLVVGNHGPGSSLLGSVSTELARRAPCPVVVVSPEADRRTAARSAEGSEPEVAGGIVRLGLSRAAGAAAA